MEDWMKPLKVNGREVPMDSPVPEINFANFAEHQGWIDEVRNRWPDADLSWRCGRIWKAALFNMAICRSFQFVSAMTEEEKRRPLTRGTEYLGLPLVVDALMFPDAIELQCLQKEDLRSWAERLADGGVIR